jgi:hypothetical protein
MTDTPEQRDEGWDDCLQTFYFSSRDARPDVGMIGKLLREDKPFPKLFRLLLADLLDGQEQKAGDDQCSPLMSAGGVGNWKLRPFYVGQHDKYKTERKKEELLLTKMWDDKINVSTAIGEIDANGVMSARDGWKVWGRIKAQWTELGKLQGSVQEPTSGVSLVLVPREDGTLRLTTVPREPQA